MARRARQWSPGWSATVVSLLEHVLLSGPKSRTYDGLWLKGPEDFLSDPLPRANAYLGRFGPPQRLDAGPVQVR